MRIRVEHDKCTGHARCAALGPDVYELDAEGFNALRGQEIGCPEGMEEQARRGAEACPEQAIVLIGAVVKSTDSSAEGGDDHANSTF
jgi:ferredoxin